MEGSSDSEADKFFAKYELKRDGLVHGYPLPKKKQGIGKRGNKSIKDVSGAIVRSLDISYDSKVMAYIGVFKKSVLGVAKVQAEIKCDRLYTGELVLQLAVDKLRNGKFPIDTYKSIKKQINELYKK